MGPKLRSQIFIGLLFLLSSLLCHENVLGQPQEPAAGNFTLVENPPVPSPAKSSAAEPMDLATCLAPLKPDDCPNRMKCCEKFKSDKCTC